MSGRISIVIRIIAIHSSIGMKNAVHKSPVITHFTSKFRIPLPF
jgi:hypothetical protein